MKADCARGVGNSINKEARSRFLKKAAQKLLTMLGHGLRHRQSP
jgi:hypothetical protein